MMEADTDLAKITTGSCQKPVREKKIKAHDKRCTGNNSAKRCI